MIKKNGSLRNVEADKLRMEAFKSKISIFHVFSSKEIKIILNYLKPYLKGIIFLIIIALGLSFLEGLKALSIVAFIKSFFIENVDALNNLKIIGKYDVANFINFSNKNALILFIFIIFAVLSIVSIIAKFIVSILTRKFQLTLMRNLRRDLYNKIVSFDMGFFNEARSGELLFMINAEVSRFSNLILHSKNLFSSSLTLFMFFAILFYMSFPITSVIVLFGILFLFFHQRIERKLKISSWLVNLYQNTLQQIFYEIIYGIKLIKLGGLEKRERNEYIDYHLKYEKENLRIVKIRLFSDGLRDAFFIFILTLFSFAFFYLVNKGILIKDSSFVLGFMFILLKVTPYFAEFQHSTLNIVESYGPLTKIVNILTKPVEEKKPIKRKDYLHIDSIENIKTKKLSFSYNNENDVLKDITTEFRRGKIYAIVGYSGVGKSTLLDLMVNLGSPTKGKILINDLEIENIDPKILKSNIGYVSQEPIIFHDTIRENVIFFKRDATQQQIDRTLEMASIKDFIYSLPKGLDTGLGERGLTVSGGERQRIGLARVFLRDFEVLLLDEATNSLDYKTEKVIYDDLKKIKKDKIIIVAAHRLSSIADFDEIIVLHKGRVEEKGRHKELMENRGVYYSLYKLQESIEGSSD